MLSFRLTLWTNCFIQWPKGHLWPRESPVHQWVIKMWHYVFSLLPGHSNKTLLLVQITCAKYCQKKDNDDHQLSRKHIVIISLFISLPLESSYRTISEPTYHGEWKIFQNDDSVCWGERVRSYSLLLLHSDSQQVKGIWRRSASSVFEEPIIKNWVCAHCSDIFSSGSPTLGPEKVWGHSASCIEALMFFSSLIEKSRLTETQTLNLSFVCLV